MSWDTICEQIDSYADFAAPVAASVRPCLAMVPSNLRIFCHPIVSKIAYDAASQMDEDQFRLIAKYAALPFSTAPISADEARRDGWIKIAESRPLRVAAENLQFLPSTTGIPNAPSPVAAMIASGLLGSGIGYGVGTLASRLTPESWNRPRMRRNAALLGGLIGAAPGALWAMANHANDKSVLSPWPNVEDPLPPEPLAKEAMETVGYQSVAPRQPGPADVNINALGQVLWEGQAPPQVTAATLGTMYAADQFPDPTAPPGWVTAHQLGQMAMATGQGYLMGKIVGKVLNIATGMPDQYAGRVGMAVGLIRTAVPRLYN